MLFGHHIDTLIGCGLGQNRLPYIFTRWKFETLYSHAESLKPYIHELKVLNPIFTSWKFETLYSHAESLKPYIHELKVETLYSRELKVWNPIFTRAEGLKPYIHELKVLNPIFTSWKFETLCSRAESLKPYSHMLKVWNPIFTSWKFETLLYIKISHWVLKTNNIIKDNNNLKISSKNVLTFL